MTQFDSAATPLLASFTDAPRLDAYTAMVPDQPLDERNTAASPMSAQSAAMDFSVEDRAPEHALNAAIWQSVRGANSSMPQPRTAFRERPALVDSTAADD